MPAQLKAGRWEPRSPDGEVVYPLPTPETEEPSPSSIYALSKYDQECMCRIIGGAYGIPTLRSGCSTSTVPGTGTPTCTRGC